MANQKITPELGQRGNRNLEEEVARQMWPTPGGKVHPNVIDPDDLVNRLGEPLKQGEKPHDRRTGRPVQTCLPDAVKLWPTPTASAHKGSGQTGTMRDRLDYAAERPEGERISGQLNPQWVEWLMGFPAGWTDLEG